MLCCAHIFTLGTSLRALDTLAGVMGHFIRQLSQQLCIHHDQQKYNESAAMYIQVFFNYRCVIVLSV